MAKYVFTNAYLLINNVDLSSNVESVTLENTAADVDVTAMGDGGKRHLAGLQDNKLNVTFWQDFAATKVDATLSGIFSAGTAVAFKIGSNGSSFSSTNPNYSGSVVLLSYQPVTGKVGDGGQTQVQFVVDGTVTRGTS